MISSSFDRLFCFVNWSLMQKTWNICFSFFLYWLIHVNQFSQLNIHQLVPWIIICLIHYLLDSLIIVSFLSVFKWLNWAVKTIIWVMKIWRRYIFFIHLITQRSKTSQAIKEDLIRLRSHPSRIDLIGMTGGSHASVLLLQKIRPHCW